MDDVDSSIGGILVKDNMAEANKDLLGTGCRESFDSGSSPVVGGKACNLKPLSLSQQRLWFVEEMRVAGPAYNEMVRVRLSGNLSVLGLRHALNQILQRHEILRTAFENIDGEVKQQVYPCEIWPFVLVDIMETPEAERIARVQEIVLAEARTQFDLRQAPLVRSLLIQISPKTSVFVMTMHHIVSDGWSMEVVARELSELYTSFVLQRDCELLPLALQYADYAVQQRQCLHESGQRRQLEYWVNKLGSCDLELRLPTDRPRPTKARYSGASVGITLGKELCSAIQMLARRHSVTVFMVVLSAWALFMARLSGQTDIVVGTPMANRDRPELEQLIGFFVSTLPLRIEVRREFSLKSFLHHVRDVVLGAFGNREVPFERIVEAINPNRTHGRHPIFQVAFAFQKSSMHAWQLHGLAATKEYVDNGTSKFDVTLLLEEEEDDISGVINFDSDLFDRSTIERWVSHYTALLGGMVEGPSVRHLSELQSLTEYERRTVIEVFNDTTVSYPNHALVSELFESQAERSPQACAATYEGLSLTYSEMNAQSNRVARYLQSCGVRPGDRVPLVMARSLQSLVAQLAILKTGAAFVPFDPSTPMERQTVMMKECDARHVVCDPGWQPSSHMASVVRIDITAIEDRISVLPIENLPRRTRSDATAYVMFTSGSTGVPKGVAVPHSAIIRLVINNGYAKIECNDCIPYYSNPAFDASTFEVWGALLNGARLVVIEQEAVLEARRFCQILIENQVSIMWMSVGLFGQYIEVLAPVLRRLRFLIVGGDVVEPRLVHRLEANGRPKNLLNAYGPTECTTFSTTYQIEVDPTEARSLSIGKPIANASVYILESNLDPVPIGAVGDIYIAGAGLALGYVNRPELTAERFLANPYGTSRGARLYMTGDVGRWRDDGNIEFLGRKDQQVKVRGFRVELTEVEAQLVQHSEVSEAAVVIVTDESGDKRLVAYVVPTSSDNLSGPEGVESIRAHLRLRSPDYMMPSAIIFLQRLPLTPNGKVDRRALPQPDADAYRTRKYEAPRGRAEETLAGAMQAVLKVERVGRDDNFFELGGHSLLLIQLMDRLRKARYDVDVHSIYEAKSVRHLAESMIEDAAENDLNIPENRIPREVGKITPEMVTLIDLQSEHIEAIVSAMEGGATNIQDIYPLAPLQEGILFHHLLDAERGDTYVLPKLFRIESRSRLNELIAALQVVIDRHEVLRTAIVWEGVPTPLQVVLRSAKLPVDEVRLDGSQDVPEQVRQWIKPELQRIDLSRAPLVRLRVAPAEGGFWYAMLQIHHIVIDHVSIEAMTADVVAQLEGRSLPKRNQALYREHVARSLVYARLRNSNEFFRRKLSGVCESTAPFGIVDTHRDGSRIRDAYEQLDPILGQRVRSRARRLGVSTATLFHAAWGLVVARTTGKQSVVFGTVLLGRLQVKASMQQTLGMFINTLPIHLNLADLSVKGYVEHVHRELVELISHEQASLSEAQRCSGIQGSTPLFTTLLNYRHSVPKSDAQWSRADGMQVIASAERTNYPITISIDDLNDTFRLKAQTDADIRTSALLTYMTRSISSIVKALEEESEERILSLSILPDPERERLLVSFNDTRSNAPKETLVHHLVERQIQRVPNAVAVVHDGVSLSYADLGARSTMVARGLVLKGVAVGDLVGLFAERGINMVVALIGILKAGAAYLPLDPEYPEERLRFMVQDAKPRVLVTSGRQSQEFQTGGFDVLELESLMGGDMPCPRDVDHYSATDGMSETLAYVIYTSGSTGRPKGTAMPHRALVNLVDWHHGVFGDGSGFRVLQFAALSFDVAFQEIFSTLCHGGTLVLIDEWMRRDVKALVHLLQTQRVNRLFVPPMMLQAIADDVVASCARLADLHDVVVAGEQLRITPEIASMFASAGRRIRLHNHYGPTETHVVSAQTLGGNVERWSQLPPIGQPIQNTSIYILDDLMNLVPIGVQGMIFVGGDCVGRGYLGRPGQTALRFTADPFTDSPGTRMYMTGDVGRWQEDGSIEYLGRSDSQVKVRGYRVELGEVEAALSSLGQFKEVAVVAATDASGSKRLIAYVTGREGSRVEQNTVKERLKGLIPEYMVPAAIVYIDELPRTPSGKLDRRAMQELEIAGSCCKELQSPRDHVERDIAQVWKDVLGIAQIGINDNFFEMGGHSLLVVKALSRINQMFSASLRVRDMYSYATVAELASRVRGGEKDDPVIDLMNESVLGDDCMPAHGQPAPVDGAVFLTGATGFVGRFLLAELLTTTTARIYCLVRSGSSVEAERRLRQVLERWDLWKDRFNSRIVPVPGDLALPDFGLSVESFTALQNNLDSVYHCGTSMNHLESYAMAKPTNVESVKVILKLAARGRPKCINYVSTLGVFNDTFREDSRQVSEETTVDHEIFYNSQGYLASKWVAEKMFLIARERGFHCNVFRLGLVLSDSRLGRFDERQTVFMVLKSCIDSGFWIKNYRFPMPPAPVDDVVRAIVCLANIYRSCGKTFHVSGADMLGDSVFDHVSLESARSLPQLPYYDWICKMKELHLAGRSMPVIPLIDYAFEMDEDSFHRSQRERRSAANICYDMRRTNEDLARCGVDVRGVDYAMLERLLYRIRSCG